jgi:broad specificity phosphatase PhoE
VTARLILIAQASTDAMHEVAFPHTDEPLDQRGQARAAALRERLPRADGYWVSPELRTRQTAQALQLNAQVQPELRECDYGRWTGSAFAAVGEREPRAVEAWLRDPAAAPHGGESIAAFIQRVGAWLAEQRAHDRRSLVVTHATVVRAVIVGAIEAPPRSFWRIDIRHLSVTRLSGGGGRWRLVSSGCEL